MPLTDALHAHLCQVFETQQVEITDNSWQHAGHAAMQGKAGAAEATHLAICIVSEQFEGKNLLARHRMVHQALSAAFESHLHALELKVYTPSEWQTQVQQA